MLLCILFNLLKWHIMLVGATCYIRFFKFIRAVYAGWRNMLVRTPFNGYAGTCAAIRDADLRSDAERIAVPTLCVAGDQDGSTPAEVVKGTSGLIRSARFELIEGAGHIPCVEKPAELSGLIERHLQEAGLV